MKNPFKIVSVLLFIVLLISLFFNWQLYTKNSNEFIADKTLDCLKLWEQKKDRLFGTEIGNYRVIYNPKLNTCLVGNIYTQKINTGSGNKYFIFVIDLITDKTLLSYLAHGNDLEDNGISWEEAIKKYEDFGLKVD